MASEGPTSNWPTPDSNNPQNDNPTTHTSDETPTVAFATKPATETSAGPAQASTTAIPNQQAPAPKPTVVAPVYVSGDSTGLGFSPNGDVDGAKPKRPSWLIGALVTALALFTAGAAGISYWAFASSEYVVNSCVVRVGEVAKSAECTTADAYKITNSVSSQEKCDPTQPVVVLERKGKDEEVLCLRPIG